MKNLVFKYSVIELGIFWLRVYEVVRCCFTWEDIIVPRERERNMGILSQTLSVRYLSRQAKTYGDRVFNKKSDFRLSAWIDLPFTTNCHLEHQISASQQLQQQSTCDFFHRCLDLRASRLYDVLQPPGSRKQRYNHQQIRPKPYTPARHLAFLPQSFSIFLKYSP